MNEFIERCTAVEFVLKDEMRLKDKKSRVTYLDEVRKAIIPLQEKEKKVCRKNC